MYKRQAEYGDFLSNHIENYGNHGSGHTNYLSLMIYEEVVELCIGIRVFNKIIPCTKKSEYYSISLDSAPDKGPDDQLTLIFRYLENYTLVERFVTFMPNKVHKSIGNV